MKDQGSNEWSQHGSSINECDPVKLPLPSSSLVKGSIGLQKHRKGIECYHCINHLICTRWQDVFITA